MREAGNAKGGLLLSSSFDSTGLISDGLFAERVRLSSKLVNKLPAKRKNFIERSLVTGDQQLA